jgi:hypothetical protein
MLTHTIAVVATIAMATPATTTWTVMSGPAVAGPNTLAAVTAFGPADAWAVGGRGSGSLTAHWNGRRWAEVRSPGAGSLSDVAGTGRADVWAVGGTADGTASVIQRWNGARWTAFPHVAATAASPLSLAGVAAIRPADAWAVGFRGTLDQAVPHTQHWDGRAWHEVPVPAPGGAALSFLTSVAGSGPSGVWAAGVALDERGFSPYFVKWDGVRWSIVDVPTTITGGYSDLHVFGPDRVVAVGTAATPDATPVVASFTHGVWRQEPLPIGAAELNAVTPDGAGGLWAVGDRTGADGEHGSPVVLRRSPGPAGTWSVVTVPVTDPGHLRDVEIVPGTRTALAVGHTGVTDDADRNLILGYGL